MPTDCASSTKLDNYDVLSKARGNYVVLYVTFSIFVVFCVVLFKFPALFNNWRSRFWMQRTNQPSFEVSPRIVQTSDI